MARLFRAVLTAGVAIIAVAVLGRAVRNEVGWLIRFDQRMVLHATSFTREHPTLRTALVVWQEVFQPWHLYLLAVGGLLWFRRRRRLAGRATWGVVTMMVCWMLAHAIKLGVGRPRPVVADAVAHAPGYSFPSGHVANLTVVCLTLLLVVRPLVPVTLFRMLGAASAVLVILTAFDRVLLGVHFPTDTLAAVVYGCGAVLASFWGQKDWNLHPRQGAGSQSAPKSMAAESRDSS